MTTRQIGYKGVHRPAAMFSWGAKLRVAIVAVLVGTSLMVTGQSFAAAAATMPSYLSDHLAACQADQAQARTLDEQAWAATCVTLAQRAVDAWVAANPTPTPSATASSSPSATPTASPSATATPSPTVAPTTTPPATTTSAPPPAGFPGASSTGVPAGVTLTAYTGPCAITVPGTIIDAKTINCDLAIRASGVEIRRSRVNGTVETGTANAGPGRSVTVSDSEITCAPSRTCVGESYFTLLRANVHGGNRMAHCYAYCTIRDSWLHGVRLAGNQDHASGMRAGQNTVIVHNTLACDVADTPQGGGCSADLTMYPDFEPIHDVLVQGNQFVNTPGYFCAYGGWEPSKPYNSDPTNATNIKYLGNTWQRGPSRRCGGPSDGGAPITSFRPERSGNQFDAANVWAPDGARVTL